MRIFSSPLALEATKFVIWLSDFWRRTQRGDLALVMGFRAF